MLDELKQHLDIKLTQLKEEQKGVIDSLKGEFETFKKENDKAIEAKKKGESASYENNTVANVEEKLTALEKKNVELQTSIQRLATLGGQAADSKKTSVEMKRAYETFYKKGADALSMEQKNLLQTQINPDGGYLISSEMQEEIEKGVFRTSPMREVATVRQIGANSFTVLSDLDEASLQEGGELTENSQTNTPQLDIGRINLFHMLAAPKLTLDIMEDAVIDIESWIAEHVSDKFGRTENAWFITGNGVNKARGIMSYASGASFGSVEQIVSGSNTDISLDSCITLQATLKAAFQANATWLLNHKTLARIRKFKDSQNQYYFSINEGISSFLGKPYKIMDDMAGANAAMAAFTQNDLVMAYGDFKKAYIIIEKSAPYVVRDTYTKAPHTILKVTKRVGGGVKNFDAFKILKVSA